MYVEKDKYRNHKALDYFLIIIGLFLFIYYLIYALFYGVVNFTLLLGIIGCIFLIYVYLELRLQRNIFYSLPKSMRKIVTCLLLIGSILFITLEGCIIYYGQQQDTYKSDAVIILGAGLHDSTITKTLALRLDKAIEYHIYHPQAILVVSGGQGKDETRTEASAMKEYLIQHGVDEDKILMEDQSTNTNENFLFSQEVLKKAGYDISDVTVITNNFHVFRSCVLAHKYGFQPHPYAAPSYIYMIPHDYTREVLAIIKSFVIDLWQ